MYGGGDTLQEFKDLNPGLYLNVIDNTQYYFFTGGGSVLTAIESGAVAVDWQSSTEAGFGLDDLEREPAEGALFAPLPAEATS
jgi:hypothetical protein